MSNNLYRPQASVTLLRPYGRPSIHAHFNCPFSNSEAMAQYEISRSRSEGFDEVDNAMSKMMPSLSPGLKIQNRHLNSTSKSNSDDSNHLSRSLPATLPSHNYSLNSAFTDDDEYENNSTEHNRFCDSDESTSDWRISERLQLQARQQSVCDNKGSIKEENVKPRTSLYIIISMFIFLVISYFYNNITVTMEPAPSLYDEVQFTEDLRNVGERFNNQVDILKIQSGITTISQRKDTGSFIFVYNSKHPKHNARKFNDFISNIGDISAKFLRSSQIRNIVVENVDLDMRSHGELVHKYRDVVESHGVVVFKQLEEVPSNLAMAFHYYCDEYNPLVKKSAIFFTLDLGKCSVSPEPEITEAVVEKCLASKWSTLPSDYLGALLTRVVSVVVDVTKVW